MCSDDQYASAQLTHDHEIALALQKSMIDNDDYVEIASASVVKPDSSPANCSAITDPASAVKKLEKLVNQDLHLLLTIRRGLIVSFSRVRGKERESHQNAKLWSST